jgi:hypothetical protein
MVGRRTLPAPLLCPECATSRAPVGPCGAPGDPNQRREPPPTWSFLIRVLPLPVPPGAVDPAWQHRIGGEEPPAPVRKGWGAGDRHFGDTPIVAHMAAIPYSKGAKVVSKHVEEILDAEYFNIEHLPLLLLSLVIPVVHGRGRPLRLGTGRRSGCYPCIAMRSVRTVTRIRISPSRRMG